MTYIPMRAAEADVFGVEKTGRLATYRITGYLGEGVTSYVYRACNVETETPVALKTLREDISDELISHFWFEKDVLTELAWAERTVGDGLAHIPRLVDWQDTGSERFLVLELVNGVSLDRLLEGSETGCLPEPDALDIADQVLRVLSLLHEYARRTYTDLQMQNICCEQGGAEGRYQVKVLDWNHVSDKVPEGEDPPEGFGAGDLARFAAYFYRMLTGKGANEQGESERDLRKRAGERWGAVSLFARQLVVRSLHPDAARRFATAAEFRAAVNELRDYWHKDWVDLLSEVKPALAALDVRRPESGIEADQLKRVLDLATRLGAHWETVDRYSRQLDAYAVDVSREWTAGERYFQAGQYRTAAEKWRSEAAAFGRSALWRRLLLADAGAELGPNEFAPRLADLQEAVSALDADHPNDALEALERARVGNCRSEALDLLRSEALARVAVYEAGLKLPTPDPETWREAARRYREADALLKKLPYGPVLSAELEWPDLQAAAKALDERLSRSECHKERVEARRRTLKLDLDQGPLRLEGALRACPTDVAVFEVALGQAEQFIKSCQTRAAVRLLELLSLYGNFGQDTESGQQIRSKLFAAREMVKTADERARVLERINSDIAIAVAKGSYAQARTALGELGPSELVNLPSLGPLQRELAERFDGALTAGVQPATDLVSLFDLLDPEPQRVAERKLRCEQFLTERLAIRIEKAVDASQWPQVLALCNQLPPEMTARNQCLYGITEKLDKRFRKAADNMNFQGVSTLLPVLGLLDPNEARLSERRRLYDIVRQQILRDNQLWLSGLLRRHSTCKPDTHKALRDAIKEIEVSRLIINGEPMLAEWGERLSEMRAEYERMCEVLTDASANKADEHAKAARHHLHAIVSANWLEVDARLKEVSGHHQDGLEVAAKQQTDRIATALHFFNALLPEGADQHPALFVFWSNLGGAQACEGLLLTDQRLAGHPGQDGLLAWISQTAFAFEQMDISDGTETVKDNDTSALLRRTIAPLICLRLLAMFETQEGKGNAVTQLYKLKTSEPGAASRLL